jgi:hypothetical protein
LKEEQYRALCDACDRVLLEPGATLERIAVPWLHVIREHPVFLQSYTDVLSSARAGAFRIKRRLRHRASWLRRLWRAFRADGSPWHATGDLPDQVDVLLVSHLLNSGQAGDRSDFYFGTLAEEMIARDCRVLVALINHTRLPAHELAKRWPAGSSPRVILSSTLTVTQERRLRARLIREESELVAVATRTPEGFDRRVVSRAAVEAVSETAQINLRLEEQINALVARFTPSAIVVTHEGHAFERITFAAARRAKPGIRCIGYQHAALFRLQHAIRRNLRAEFNPDCILAAGTVAQAELRRAGGLCGMPIGVLGSSRALRSDVATASASAEKAISRPAVCLVLPEGISSECHLLFEFSLECARTLPDMQFIWRLHPIVSFDSLLAQNPKLRDRPANVTLSIRPFTEDLAASGWALYRGSTAVIQAVSESLRPVYLAREGEMSIDPLYGLEGFREALSTVAQFSTLVRIAATEDRHDSAEASRRAREYCNALYVPFNIDALLAAVRLDGVRPTGTAAYSDQGTVVS